MTTFKQKLGLLRGLLNGEQAYTGPFFVDIDITERCNLHCLGCPYHSVPGRSNRNASDLSLSIFRELCDELQTMGTRSLFLQGPGEPMLHPALDEVIRVAKGTGFHVVLATNGTLLDRETIRYFISARLDVLRISLWAATPEEYLDNYPGVDPANLGRVIENLRLAVRLKRELGKNTPQILLHQPVNRLNYQRLDRLVDLASATGCDGVSFTPVHHHPGAMASFVLETEQVRKVKDQLRKVRATMKTRFQRDNLDKTLLRFDLGISTLSRRPCYACWLHTHLCVDGKVYPCGHCHVLLGNVCERPFREIWTGPDYRSFRKRILFDAGVLSMGAQAQCSYCCLAAQNDRVHGFFRWILPLVR
jgi:MoaA/NifB/PqqE/SkfB family radical SAM enzyme